MELLRRTNAWRTIGGHVRREDPVETWREGCWELFAFEASFEGKLATAVFALGLGRRRPACRALLRRGFTGATILETVEERLASSAVSRTTAASPAPVRA